MAENNSPEIQAEIDRLKAATGLQDREDALFGKLEDGLMKFSSIDTNDMLQLLKDAAGDDVPELDELKAMIEAEEADK